MPKEIEIKFRIDGLPAITRALKQAGFKQITRSTHEMNSLYDLPGQKLRKRGELLRLRKYGDRWMLIGDAAAFLDPIFSSGVHVSVTSAKLAFQVLDKCLKTGASIKESGLGAGYQHDLNLGIQRFHNLISMFYTTNFVAAMKKTISRPNTYAAFTSAIAGDMWNEDNIVFKMNAL